MQECGICHNAKANRTHRAREMMFGFRDEFEYLECGRCGTIQLIEVPELSRYYPSGYYSMTESEHGLSSRIRSRLAARAAVGSVINGQGGIWRFLASRRPWIPEYFPVWMREPSLRLSFGSRILDVGCGTGRLLRTLRYFGFRNLSGADPFIKGDIAYPDGVRIVRSYVREIKGEFDLVMMNHSLEHAPDPVETLRAVRGLVSPGGRAVIRIPVAGFAWEKYGVNWFQLDPPRHLFVFTERSFRTIAAEAGFDVYKVLYDSDNSQFWVSEQYIADIPMTDRRGYSGNVANSIFTAVQLAQWQRDAERLNAEGRGDQACFYLKRKEP